MNFSIINTIFRKEIKEVLRDKRMIYLVILLPFFLYPGLFFLIGKVSQSQQEQMGKETVQVLVNPEAENTPLVAQLKQTPGLDIKATTFDRAMLDTMKNTIGLQIAPDFENKIKNQQSAQVEILANQSKELIEFRQKQIVAQIEAMNQSLLQSRLNEAGLHAEFTTPIAIQKTDLASREMKFGKAIGMYLPMMLLLFIFMGAIYIAIDITAGEKERRTLQTLFTTPARIPEIIAGKFLAVFSVAVTSAFMNLSSLAIAVMLQAKLMGGNISSFKLAVTPDGWMWLILIVIFSAVLLSALSLAVVLLANSYKEAQSYVSPLMMVVLIPAILVQLPGMELNMTTALIPMLNICLGMGAIFKGTYTLSSIAMVTGLITVHF